MLPTDGAMLARNGLEVVIGPLAAESRAGRERSTLDLYLVESKERRACSARRDHISVEESRRCRRKEESLRLRDLS